MKKAFLIATSLMLLVAFGPGASAQPPTYGGPLLYRMSLDASAPPIYPGQPSQVTTAYLWLDAALRHDNWGQISSFIDSLTWGDTAKTIAAVLYRMQDDNPVSYYLWSGRGMTPNPYHWDPGQGEYLFAKHVLLTATDTGRTAALLFPEIISDIIVQDTVCTQDPYAHAALDEVLVNATILDEIKGLHKPACPQNTRTIGKGAKTQSNGFSPTYADTASVGACIQFQYSPEWSTGPNDDTHSTQLRDAVGGWWIKPGQEYIVFLSFLGIGYDHSNHNQYYFTTVPHGFPSCGGMYPVLNGIVFDPNDDFGFGATGLTVAEWKSRLRGRIAALINR